MKRELSNLGIFYSDFQLENVYILSEDSFQMMLRDYSESLIKSDLDEKQNQIFFNNSLRKQLIPLNANKESFHHCSDV